MSNNQSTNTRPGADNSGAILESLVPGISKARIGETDTGPETMETVRFVHHFWSDIPNVQLAGYNFGVQHYVLPRMTPIPLRVWPTPVIMPRGRGMVFSSFTSEGAFPSGGVGSKVSQRFQFPNESLQKLLQAYGKDSPNDIGMIELSSLKAETDQQKLESILVYKAIMETTFDDTGLRGVDLPVERLLTWLDDGGVASKLLQRALNIGVTVKGAQDALPLSKQTAPVKGRKLIEDLYASALRVEDRALNKNTGILEQTKGDLIGASKGQKDVKIKLDLRDEFLLSQFPSYSLDTDVERATRANRSVTDAIQESGKEATESMRVLIENQRHTTELLAQAQAQNAELMKALLGAQQQKDAGEAAPAAAIEPPKQ
jgi:hypothetical protein